MIIAAAQMACAVGDIESNLRKMREFVAQAKQAGATWIVFPEMADTGYIMSVIREKASSWSNGIVPELRLIARESGVGIVCGVAEREGDFIFNSQVVIAAGGEIIGRYRKGHLFSPSKEDKCFTPGAKLVSLNLGDFHAGLSICYDLRFPELFRALTCREGANLFLVSSAWPIARSTPMQLLSAARAIENQTYLVFSNRLGTDVKTTFCGSSAIIDPLGNIVAQAGSVGEELIQAKLDLAVVAEARRAIPVLESRRPELYETVKSAG